MASPILNAQTGLPYTTDDFTTDANPHLYNDERSVDGKKRFPEGLFEDVVTWSETVNPTLAFSATSLAIGTGSKAFVLTQARSLKAGGYFVYSAAGATVNGMYVTLAADITASTAFTVTCESVAGAGTFTDWVITKFPPSRLYRLAITGAVTIAATDAPNWYDATSGTFTITLPTATNAGMGWTRIISNSGTGVVTLSEMVDGATYILSQYQSVTISSNGSAYRAISEGGRGNEALQGPPTFTNSWAEQDAANRPVRYWKSRAGIVYLQGAITTGTANTAAFTLPAGYRPAYLVQDLGYDLGATPARIQIATTGVVTVAGNGAAGAIPILDHLFFRAA